MLRRIVIASLSLVLGVAVSAGLLVYSGSLTGGRIVYAIARDLPAGAPITADVLTEVHAGLDPGQTAGLFGVADRTRLLASRARHQLSSGQLLQRNDVQAGTADAADSLVEVPVRNLPPTRSGDRVDLFVLLGSGDHVVAEPFALAVPVAAVTSGGLVLQVRPRQELAFVYAAGTMQLAAVVTGGATSPIDIAPIGSGEAALAAAAG
jgi:hypothetical protein